MTSHCFLPEGNTDKSALLQRCANFDGFVIDTIFSVINNFTMAFLLFYECLFSEVTVRAVTELDNKAAHCHTPVLQRHCSFLIIWFQ